MTPSETKLFINGKWCDGSKGRRFETINPATGKAISEVSLAEVEDVDKAVESARKALKGWKNLNPEKRRQLLIEVSRKVRQGAMEIAKLEVIDSGSTIRKALGDVNFASFNIRFFAQTAEKLLQKEVEMVESLFINHSYVRREPAGVCASIIPWNFPFLMAIWKVVPALAMGNTVVLKPAPQTPLTALKLAKIFEECNLPPGVLNVITGDAEIGEAMVTHPDVNKVAFTGSTEVGKRIMELSAKTLKRVTLELGGKNPFIVLEDADLNLAVDGAIFANFYHSGQVCTSGTRVLVHQSIYDEFVERVLERVQKIKIGNPEDMSTGMGPLISKEHREKVMFYVEEGKKEGAELLCGGKIPEGFEMGYFYEPTVFKNVKNDMKIARDEIFGPVMSILSFKNDEEAISIANDTHYGLAASVWSQNITRAAAIARGIEAGTIWINEHHILNERAPFGGFKQSGIGRELGESGLLAYAEEKHISTSLVFQRSRRMWYDVLF